MILESSHHHEAAYDDDGNILLPEEGRLSRHDRRDDAHAPARNEASSAHALNDMRRRLADATRAILQEGAMQYHWSFRGAQRYIRDAANALWAFLAQPVWVMNRKKNVKEYSRGMLFLLDTVRFGATFAALFLGLFISLNYQSFTEMASAYIAPIQKAQSAIGAAHSDSSETSGDHLKANLITSQKQQGDLLSFLPPVGPPIDLLVIPKLGLNVPIANPPFDALLSEDWEKLEKDIQDSLQHGVVHYPGTARPGQAGNFFLTGHSSYYPWAPGDYKTVFARLHDLDVGDEYFVYYNGEKYRYVVREKKEVKPSNVHVLDQPLDQRVATMMTCTPVGTTLRRLIISAEEIDPVTGEPMLIGEQHSRPLPKIQTQMLPI